ncbi:hypothetical protein RIF23_08240 [Lipingzhangella sp. LS1_29]|uniref:DUF1707 domain-containing protein n=1 Tax=Lipingzhangella rawalii TaxID=2055835 RepID=A0ABU2H4Q5_9ACTN|nr:hypothetical protein [Lipingzhangella rawalii]MDS1270281.1 hypothetical protein [Lipingzhangella rawalii]
MQDHPAGASGAEPEHPSEWESRGGTRGEMLSTSEVAASLSASRELGREYDREVAEALTERLDEIISARITEQLEARSAGSPRRDPPIAVPITTGIVAIPLAQMGLDAAGGTGMAVAGVLLLLLNVIYFWFWSRSR